MQRALGRTRGGGGCSTAAHTDTLALCLVWACSRTHSNTSTGEPVGVCSLHACGRNAFSAVGSVVHQTQEFPPYQYQSVH